MKNTGECQICGRTQKLSKDGTLVKHGYRRIYYSADCVGTHHKPITESTSAIDLAIRELQSAIIKNQEQINNGNTKYSYIVYNERFRTEKTRSVSRQSLISEAEDNIKYLTKRKGE